MQYVNRPDDKNRGGGLALIHKDGAVVKNIRGRKMNQFESAIWDIKCAAVDCGDL
jgi:hypothetical protein